MERRNFIKLSAVTGAMAALDACGKPDQQLIRFIPDERLIPGIATWKPSVCTLCNAGCGLLVRVMSGEAEVLRNGVKGIIKMGLAKKLEGNPNHPVNLGKLCPRGQAGLQVTYHPDRVRHPLKRSGPRGSGQFEETTWDDALKDVASHLSMLRSSEETAALAFLARPLRGQRRELIDRFLKSYGAPPAITYEALDEAVLRRANLLSFGHAALPTVDLRRADYLISFGADFLGTWNSPVSQSIGYGEMRQGRPGRRGKFVQVETRMSQTGANADEWVPCRPGAEGVLALGICHVILREKLRPNGAAGAGSLIAGWSEGLPDYTPAEIEKRTGVAAATVARLAHEITERETAAAIVGGAPLAHTNGLFNALAVNALESLVDASASGATLVNFLENRAANATPRADQKDGHFSQLTSVARALVESQPRAPKVLFLYDCNPVFSAPRGAQVPEALANIPYIVSFGSFIDETSVMADLILPDHAPLESWLDDVPESGSRQMAVSLAPPAVRPLYNTRAMPDVMLELARQLGGDVAAQLPWKGFDEMLRAATAPLRLQAEPTAEKSEAEFWRQIQQQGGWWDAQASSARPGTTAAVSSAPKAAEAEFDGPAADFPFHFLPYPSQAFREGSLANLPWLQEMPDPLTSAMWSSWVEINPKTAVRIGIHEGDLVEISSRHGSLRAPAVISPGIAPDVIAMPMGQGHTGFGRYATDRGANAFSILAPLTEPTTGSHAWAATRVKISRVGGPEQARLILFAGGMSRFPDEREPR